MGMEEARRRSCPRRRLGVSEARESAGDHGPQHDAAMSVCARGPGLDLDRDRPPSRSGPLSEPGRSVVASRPHRDRSRPAPRRTEEERLASGARERAGDRGGGAAGREIEAVGRRRPAEGRHGANRPRTDDRHAGAPPGSRAIARRPCRAAQAEPPPACHWDSTWGHAPTSRENAGMMSGGLRRGPVRTDSTASATSPADRYGSRDEGEGRS